MCLSLHRRLLCFNYLSNTHSRIPSFWFQHVLTVRKCNYEFRFTDSQDIKRSLSIYFIRSTTAVRLASARSAAKQTHLVLIKKSVDNWRHATGNYALVPCCAQCENFSAQRPVKVKAVSLGFVRPNGIWMQGNKTGGGGLQAEVGGGVIAPERQVCTRTVGVGENTKYKPKCSTVAGNRTVLVNPVANVNIAMSLIWLNIWMKAKL